MKRLRQRRRQNGPIRCPGRVENARACSSSWSVSTAGLYSTGVSSINTQRCACHGDKHRWPCWRTRSLLWAAKPAGSASRNAWLADAWRSPAAPSPGEQRPRTRRRATGRSAAQVMPGKEHTSGVVACLRNGVKSGWESKRALSFVVRPRRTYAGRLVRPGPPAARTVVALVVTTDSSETVGRCVRARFLNER